MPKKRGRPHVGDGERIVNYAELTAPQKYKDAILDLENRTGRDRHLYFRDALKEYVEKHNVEFFIRAKQEEISRNTREVAAMQAKIEERDRENRGRADASARNILSEQMYLGARINHEDREKLASQLSTKYQLPIEEMIGVVEKVYLEFAEKYRGNYKKIREI